MRRDEHLIAHIDESGVDAENSLLLFSLDYDRHASSVNQRLPGNAACYVMRHGLYLLNAGRSSEALYEIV